MRRNFLMTIKKDSFVKVAGWLGTIVALIGVVVLVGWFFDITALKVVIPGHVSMKVNTAISFICLGIALTIHARYGDREKSVLQVVAQALPLVAVTLGILNSIEYAANVDLGIDQLLFNDPQLSALSPFPGRMAPVTCVNLVFFGLALFFYKKGNDRLVVKIMTDIAGAISLLAIIGAIYGVIPLVPLVRYTHIAVHTSFAFLLLFFGIMFSQPEFGIMKIASDEGSAGLLARWLLPAVIVLEISTGKIRLFFIGKGLVTKEYGSAVSTLVNVCFIIGFFALAFRALKRSEDDLRRHREHLEELVDERTAKLKEVNEYLSEEVEERTRAEEALHLASAYNRSLIEASLDPLVTIGPDGRITDVNAATEAVTGRSRAELVGTDFSDYFTDPEKARTGYKEVFREGYVLDYELEVRHKDGHTTPVLYNASVYRDETGGVTGVFAAARDITERKRADEAGALNSQRMEALLHLNQMMDATMQEVTDFVLEEAVRLTQSKIGYLAFLNEDESILTMNSWSKSAMAECAISEKPFLYPVESTGLWGEAVRQRRPIITNDYAADNQWKKGCPQGHVALVRHMNVPVFDGSKIVIVAGVGNKAEEYDQGDVQQLILLMESMWRLLERKKAEEALRLAGVYNRSLIEASLDPLVTIGPDGKITDVNAATEAVTGRNRADLVGTDFSDYFTDPEKARAGYKEVFSSGYVLDYELEVRHKEGHVTPVLYNASVYRDETGNVKGVFAAARDITEKKKAEKAIMRMNDELEQRVVERTVQLTAANKELEAFCYSVSHDLRSPLRSIDGFSQAVLEDYEEKLDDRGRDCLHRVRAASQRMGQLIDDLLKLSRVTRGEMQNNVVDLSSIVRHVAEGLRESEPGRQVELIVHEGLAAEGDPQLLRVVLENLLGNAWKFTSKHQTAKIEFGMETMDGTQAYFVRDDGSGFDMAYSEKLFGPFQRLHAVTDFPGTGIGLATVQRIITRHGGKVWAEGGVEKGATFYFTVGQGVSTTNKEAA